MFSFCFLNRVFLLTIFLGGVMNIIAMFSVVEMGSFSQITLGTPGQYNEAAIGVRPVLVVK